jgi:DNA-binding response OmpR family regulator
MLRRPRASSTDGLSAERIEVGGLSLDAEARTLHVDGSLTEVTRTEFDLLAVMASRPRAALTRRQLIEAVWGPGWFGDEHVVDVHIGHLRTKLGDDASEPRFIRTVRGVGYGLGPG